MEEKIVEIIKQELRKMAEDGYFDIVEVAKRIADVSEADHQTEEYRKHGAK